MLAQSLPEAPPKTNDTASTAIAKPASLDDETVVYETASEIRLLREESKRTERLDSTLTDQTVLNVPRPTNSVEAPYAKMMASPLKARLADLYARQSENGGDPALSEHSSRYLPKSL